MKKSCQFGIALLLAATPAFAQSDPLTKDITDLYERIRLNLIETADLVSESDYSFRPTAEVRSIGELIGHVANAQYFFCSVVKGEASPNFSEHRGGGHDQGRSGQGLA